MTQFKLYIPLILALLFPVFLSAEALSGQGIKNLKQYTSKSRESETSLDAAIVSTDVALADYVKYLQKRKVYKKFKPLLVRLSQLNDTVIRKGEVGGTPTYDPWENYLTVNPDFFDQGKIVMLSGADKKTFQKNMAMAGEIMHELFHAYIDQVIDEECPEVAKYLKKQSSQYGQNTDTAKNRPLSSDEKYEVLEEAIGGSLDSYTVQQIMNASGGRQMGMKTNFGYLNLGAGEADYDNGNHLDKDTWELIKSILEHGCKCSVKPIFEKEQE